MDIFTAVSELCRYGIDTGLIEKEDKIYTQNQIIRELCLDEMKEMPTTGAPLEEILKTILDYAVSKGICQDSVVYRDLFDTKIMGLLTPRPSQVIGEFKSKYSASPQEATDYYFHLSRSTDYIRTYRVKNDIKWITKTQYGDIDITINMSKPEKDSKDIMAALKMKNTGYPECMLCKENEGYAGRLNHPARENHRIIPLTLGGESWFFQYSPYVYYNEHCIVFNDSHVPMKVDKTTFVKLFDFVKQFPHYFLGSNAGLPIVGGSILTHEHYQGGRYEFAMAKAQIENELHFDGYNDVEAGIVKWPMSVIRLTCADPARICDLSEKILTYWRKFSDESQMIYANTNGENHNTVTPIARFKEGKYQMDLVLRSNITTDEYPDGYFHPHPEHHHIKHENIGLIEVMGLAVLPSRLKNEMGILKDAMLTGKDIKADERIAKHNDWVQMIMAQNEITPENCSDILRREIGKVFTTILEQCGVFSRTEKGKEAFLKFANSVNK